MNAHALRSVRSSLVAALFVAHGLLMGQEQGSLTKEFPKMSAKERSRIAEKEAAEAAADQAYQAQMALAEKDFQARRYEEALAAYEKARELRPYNVYPKVKIEDLKAMLKRQEAAKDTTAAQPPPVPQPKNEPPVVAAPVPTPKAQPEPVKPAPQRTDPQPVKSKPSPPVKTTELHPEPTKPKAAAPIGMEERTYTEGNAIVVERTVDDNGQRVVYKRVIHSWGQVFCFKDGLSVDERVWKERFGE